MHIVRHLATQAAAKAAPLPAELTGKVVVVHDGDMLTLLVGRQQYKVRLHGIDAPELGQDFGTRAKQALSSKAFGQVVRVTTNGRNQYGRVLGTVWLGDGSVNKELLAEGWAWHHTKRGRLCEPDEGHGCGICGG